MVALANTFLKHERDVTHYENSNTENIGAPDVYSMFALIGAHAYN